MCSIAPVTRGMNSSWSEPGSSTSLQTMGRLWKGWRVSSAPGNDRRRGPSSGNGQKDRGEGRGGLGDHPNGWLGCEPGAPNRFQELWGLHRRKGGGVVPGPAPSAPNGSEGPPSSWERSFYTSPAASGGRMRGRGSSIRLPHRVLADLAGAIGPR